MKKEVRKKPIKTVKRPGPVWKQVTENVPHCPKCGGRLDRAKGDAATVFDWECHTYGCWYVC